MSGHLQIIKRIHGQYFAHFGSTYQIENLLDPDFLLEENTHALHTLFKPMPHVSSLSPCDYGLLVIDFDTKWIGSLQGYTDIRSFNAMGLGLAFRGPGAHINPTLDYAYLFSKAFELGWIKTFKSGNPASFASLDSLGLKTLEDIRAFVLLNPPRRLGMNDGFLYQPPGWTMDAWQTMPKETLSMAKALIDRQFPIESTLKDWQTFMQDEGVALSDVIEERREEQFIQDNFETLVLKYQAEKIQQGLQEGLPVSEKSSQGKEGKSFL